MEANQVEAEQPAGAPAITCGPENVQAFNARLRAELPELHAFARALHERGMIAGLRGARIGPLGAVLQAGVEPVLSDAAESRLAGKNAGARGVR